MQLGVTFYMQQISAGADTNETYKFEHWPKDSRLNRFCSTLVSETYLSELGVVETLTVRLR